MKKIIFALTSLSLSIFAGAQTFTVNYITYTVNTGSNVKTTDYDMAGGTVVNIPTTVTDPSTSTIYNVLYIGTQSFKNNNLTSVTLPAGLLDIAEQAFTGNDLTTITIPNTVVGIGTYAFSNNSLSSIDIPSNVTYLGSYMFRQNLFSDFSNVNFPNGVIPVGCFKDNQITNLVLPNSITNIGNEAFINNQMTTVALPSSLTTIGENAFENNLISTVSIPNSVTSIGIKSFLNNQITSFTLPNTLTTIPESMFYNNLLTNVTIPNHVTSLGKSAFRGNQITSVTLSDSLTNIGIAAFFDNQISTIAIPNSVTNIGESAFGTNQLTAVTIPWNVTTIGSSAFKNNPLTSVIAMGPIPATITTGGSYDTFNEIRGTIDLIIPTGKMAVYVTDQGALWTDFNTVTETDVAYTNIENDAILSNEVKLFSTNNGLEIIFNKELELKNYTLFSLSGKLIKTGIETTISTNKISSGIYLLKLDFNEGTLVKKVAFN
jgi:hypothetical protein